MKHKLIESGTVFTWVTVIEYVGCDDYRSHNYKCVCKCGKEFITRSSRLRTGYTKSCGCKSRSQHYKHGRWRTKTHSIWCGMRSRCLNKNNLNYHNYGGRGITIHPRWDDFEKFLQDMGECPPGLSIDRIDNNGNYGPDNCRWATMKQQANNKRTNRFIEYEGRKMTEAQWAKEKGIPPGSISSRIRKNWCYDCALNKPAGGKCTHPRIGSVKKKNST